MAPKVQHKRSAVAGKAPQPADLDYGEIGVNYEATDPALYIKDSANAIRKIGTQPDATETVKGIVEFATAAETTTGTDATRAVHPAGLKAAMDAAQLWDRTGTVISPVTAGDDVTLDGKLLVGTTTTTSPTQLLVQGNSTHAQGPAIVELALGKTTPSPIEDLGMIRFSDSSHARAAEISAHRDAGTWTTGVSQPTRLTFKTSPDGAATPVDRVHIMSDGKLLIGVPSAPAGAPAGCVVVHQLAAAAYGQLAVDTDGQLVRSNIALLPTLP